MAQRIPSLDHLEEVRVRLVAIERAADLIARGDLDALPASFNVMRLARTALMHLEAAS